MLESIGFIFTPAKIKKNNSPEVVMNSTLIVCPTHSWVE